jgi:hypothetical protein
MWTSKMKIIQNHSATYFGVILRNEVWLKSSVLEVTRNLTDMNKWSGTKWGSNTETSKRSES